jgi:hypothetical protein
MIFVGLFCYHLLLALLLISSVSCALASDCATAKAALTQPGVVLQVATTRRAQEARRRSPWTGARAFPATCKAQ